MYTFWIILTSFLVSANCSIVGSWLIIRKEAMLGDAITHAVLPGIVLAFMLTGSLHPLFMLFGAIVAGVAAVLCIGFLQTSLGVRADIAITITFTSFLSAGLLLIALFTRKADLDQGCVLFGNLLHVPLSIWSWRGVPVAPLETLWLLLLLIGNIFFLAVFHRSFFIVSFDTDFADSVGFKSRYWHHLLLLLVAITSVASLKMVGVSLVTTFLVVPPATAWLLSVRFQDIIFLALAMDIVAAALGYFLAVQYNVSASASIAAVTGLGFLSGLFVSMAKAVLSMLGNALLLAIYRAKTSL